MTRADAILVGGAAALALLAAGSEIGKRTAANKTPVVEYVADSLLTATIAAHQDTIFWMRRDLANCVGVLYIGPKAPAK